MDEAEARFVGEDKGDLTFVIAEFPSATQALAALKDLWRWTAKRSGVSWWKQPGKGESSERPVRPRPRRVSVLDSYYQQYPVEQDDDDGVPWTKIGELDRRTGNADAPRWPTTSRLSGYLAKPPVLSGRSDRPRRHHP